MNSYTQELRSITQALIIEAECILAMDESNGTCNRRFDNLEIATTEENHQTYRELILTAPNLNNYVSRIIVYDETIRLMQKW